MLANFAAACRFGKAEHPFAGISPAMYSARPCRAGVLG